ncbi:hypothetical protein CPC08DRAFT_797666 [Agrocybe pediades]|nr:hypothetical protein CPC08DRAFT_797666 [Agrocybe pediades]
MGHGYGCPWVWVWVTGSGLPINPSKPIQMAGCCQGIPITHVPMSDEPMGHGYGYAMAYGLRVLRFGYRTRTAGPWNTTCTNWWEGMATWCLLAWDGACSTSHYMADPYREPRRLNSYGTVTVPPVAVCLPLDLRPCAVTVRCAALVSLNTPMGDP